MSFLRETIALFLSMVSRYPETHAWLIDQGIVELASQMYKTQERKLGEREERLTRYIPFLFSNIIWQENGRRRLRESGAFNKLSEISALIQKAHNIVPFWMLLKSVLRDGEESWLGEPVILKMLGKMLKGEIGVAAVCSFPECDALEDFEEPFSRCARCCRAPYCRRVQRIGSTLFVR